MSITIIPHCTCDRCGAQADGAEIVIIDPNIQVPVAEGWGRMSAQSDASMRLMPGTYIVLCPDCSAEVTRVVSTPPDTIEHHR
jgi:hypothetical protein